MIYQRALFFAFVLSLGISLAACDPEDAENDDARAEGDVHIPDAPEALQAAWKAHGGLDTWRAQRSARYTFERTVGDTSTQDEQFIDLHDRRVRITGDDFVLGFDGAEAWVAPDLDAFPYDSDPRFYTSTYFYFWAMPFLLADPGVIATDAGTTTLNGTTYNVTEIRYEDDVGDSPDDVYIAYTDAETHELDVLRFSVTYGGRESEPDMALVFDEWTTINGLKLPVESHYRTWEAGALGDPAGPVLQYHDIELGTEPPAFDLFERPQDAEIAPAPDDA